MYNAPRAASIVCIVRGKLYGLDRLTFNAIVHGSAASRKNNYSQILSKVELLAEMDSYEKDLLCDALREEKFSAGSYVVRQGDHGDRFYIVAEGNLVAEKGEPKETVWKYKESDYFGEIALMKNTVRQASVKAVTDCTLVSVERDTFKRLLGPVEDILRRNM